MTHKKRTTTTQLTVRGFDEHLERRLREVARQHGVSLNRAALYLLRKGAGLGPKPTKADVGDSLDRLIGSWSETEAEEFLETVSAFERVDNSFWR
ncbi:MAG: hypothetical protein HY000_26100 [Planctomycetes bacterium]|nr:hypothetical protein [Planctomycetota bacterium]